MKILIVGAGATGTVFGATLVRAGCEVTYFVREHHRARLARGLDIYRQGMLGVTADHIDGIAVLTGADEVAAQTFDEVWFTTASDALRGPWLEALVAATGRATLVVLQPDPEDIQYVRDHGGRDRTIVQGLIQFSAWQSPMPHEPREQQGVTWLAPPGPAALFDADCAESATIAATLTRGGLAAATRSDLPAHAARLTALTIPLVAGLELAGWQLERYARHEALNLALDAARETVRAECARFNVAEPLAFRLLLNRPATWLLLRAIPWVPGFKAEAFLAYHFGKVDRQTRQLLATYSRHAAQNGLPHRAIDRLLATLPPPTH